MKIGKFKVSGALYRQLRESPDDLILIQAGMAVIRTEDNMMADVVEFYAIGPMFDEVEEGCGAPEYIFQVNTPEDGNKTVEFIRIS